MNKRIGLFHSGVTETLLVSTLLILVAVVMIRDRVGIVPLVTVFALVILAFRKGPKIAVAGSPISLLVLLALFAGPFMIAILAVLGSPWTLYAAIAVTIAYVLVFAVGRVARR